MRVIDSTPLRARHIKRATSTTKGAVEVLPGQWWAPSGGSVEGRQGWQSAGVERRLSDHALLSGLAFPNAPGDDGQLHRERFAVRTDPDYRLGSEWVEVTDEATGRPLIVATPDTARVDRANVGFTGCDAAGILGLFREEKVAPWTPSSPLDVIGNYSRAPQQVSYDKWDGYAVAEDVPWPGPWTTATTATGTVNPVGSSSGRGGILLSARGPNSPAAVMRRDLAQPVGQRAPFIVTVNVVAGTADVGGAVQIELGSAIFVLQYPNVSGASNQSLLVFAPTGSTTAAVQKNIATAPFPDGTQIELTIVGTDGWLYFLRDGQVVAQLRRDHTAAAPITRLSIGAYNATAIVQSVLWRTARPFLRRGAPTPDYMVAGAPTSGGLRGDYFNTYDEFVKAGGNYLAYGQQIPAPLAEPYARRLDPVVSFSSNPATWMPPGPPSGEGFAVRWSGSIYLDLATNDRSISLDLVDDMARVWVGTTRADAPYLNAWGRTASGFTQGPSLRGHLGTTKAGWFPIVIEYANGASAGGIRLQDIAVGGQAWVTVPANRLSPYGCWEGDLGGESYREAVDQVTTTMGLQWRVQPRTLESGEFPGRLEAAARLGTDTDYVIGEDEATEYASEVAATETVDRVLADAAGLGDSMGREGLTAELVDRTATTQPWLTTRYESLGDITEQQLLQQRMSSILALYGSPGETVAARPLGQDTLADSFPATGQARLFLWEPGDGVRLDLPSVGVLDRTPRGITSVAWPLVPDGRGAPSVGFRQRPRHLNAVLQRLGRQANVARRHYQGQLSESPGTMGSSAAGVAPDGYSRLHLPPGRTAKLIARVPVVTDGTLEVMGINTGLSVTRAGEYDVTPWIPAAGGYTYARILNPSAIYLLQLVAVVRV